MKRLITNRFKFDEAKEAFALVRRKEESAIKVMIEGVQDRMKSHRSVERVICRAE